MTTLVLSLSFQFDKLTSLHRQCLVVNYRSHLPSLFLAGTAELCLPRSGTEPSALPFRLQQTTALPPTTRSIWNPSSGSPIIICLELLWASTWILWVLWIDDGVGGVIVVPAE